MLTFLNVLNKKSNNYLQEKGIIPRRDASSGFWLSFLLPLAIIIGKWKYSLFNTKDRTLFFLCCGFITHTLLDIMYVYRRNSMKFFNFNSCMGALFVTSTLSTLFIQEGVIFNVFCGIVSIIVFHKTVLIIMKLCPKNYTFGEAITVTQAIIIYLVSFLNGKFFNLTTCMEKSTAVLHVGIVCIMSIGIMSYNFSFASSPLKFYLSFLIVNGLILIPSLTFMLRENPFSWILNLLMEDNTSIVLVTCWCFLTCIGIFVIILQVQSNIQASTVVRKIFHILAFAVFVPGLLFKPCLLYLSSGVVFAIFFFLDMLRILRIPPLGLILQSGFSSFADSKDEGPFALTPLYLLAGISLPIWIHPNTDLNNILPLLAGLLSVGIGDTAASISGTWFGKNKWPGSKKTKEGTAACFLSQLFLVIALIHFEYVPRNNLVKPFFATAVTSIVEAKTDQVDNIVLPLLFYIMVL